MNYLTVEFKIEGRNSIIDIDNINPRNSFIIRDSFLFNDEEEDRKSNNSNKNNNVENREILCKIFRINDKNNIYDEKISPKNTKILGIIDNYHLIMQEKDTKNRIKYIIYNYDKNNKIFFGSLLARQDLDFQIVGKNKINGEIYFALIEPNCSISEFSFLPSKGDIQEIGAYETSLEITNNLIIKKTLFVEKKIMVMNKDEVFEIKIE
jgi:hypothetical protein